MQFTHFEEITGWEWWVPIGNWNFNTVNWSIFIEHFFSSRPWISSYNINNKCDPYPLITGWTWPKPQCHDLEIATTAPHFPPHTNSWAYLLLILPLHLYLNLSFGFQTMWLCTEIHLFLTCHGCSNSAKGWAWTGWGRRVYGKDPIPTTKREGQGCPSARCLPPGRSPRLL